MRIKPIRFGLVFILFWFGGCASTELPEEHHDHFVFPEYRVYIEEPTGKALKAPYKVLGWVRSKESFPTMEQAVVNSESLCKNYYNKAARQLLKEAEKVKADAVIKVRSIVFMMDGTTTEYPTPECSDDGAEGEILLRGIAIQFLPTPSPSPSPKPTP